MASVTQMMLCLAELTDGSVTKIRKTLEDPPRVAIYDVLQLVTGCSSNSCSIVYQRITEAFPEVLTKVSVFKFSGRGQRDTPITDAHGIVELLMVMPGKAAAKARRGAAEVMVRYLGGDMSLVQEIATNHMRQEDLEEDDPARIFGEAVESENLKRKREEVEMVELEGRLKKSRVKRLQIWFASHWER